MIVKTKDENVEKQKKEMTEKIWMREPKRYI